jgi:hypothetical protein
MQIRMKKGFIFSVLSIVLLACSGSKETDQGELVQINPEFAEYIAAFTGGTVPADGSIKVQFNQEIEKSKQIKENGDLFTFEPEVDGEINWIDNNTIEFVPEEPLKAGIRYKASLDISQILEVKEGLEVFEFNFRTAKWLSILLYGLKTILVMQHF